MRGKSSCRKHNIHSRQPPEQHKTKTRKQHECKWLQKHRKHTETNKHILKHFSSNKVGHLINIFLTVCGFIILINEISKTNF